MLTRYNITYLCLLCRWQENMRVAIGEDPKKCPRCECADPYDIAHPLMFPDAVALGDVFTRLERVPVPSPGSVVPELPESRRVVWRGILRDPFTCLQAEFQHARREALAQALGAWDGYDWGLEIVIRDDGSALVVVRAGRIIASRYLALVPASEVRAAFGIA